MSKKSCIFALAFEDEKHSVFFGGKAPPAEGREKVKRGANKREEKDDKKRETGTGGGTAKRRGECEGVAPPTSPSSSASGSGATAEVRRSYGKVEERDCN